MFGDPAMLVVPALGLAVIALGVFALGAPGRPEVLTPMFAAPPADAFADAGIVGLVDRSSAWAWAARAALAVARALVYGIVVALAVARASGEVPSLGSAVRRIARLIPGLVVLAGLAMGYAHAVAGGPIEPGREAGVAGTALVVGMLFFPAAFVAAVTDGRGILGALRRSGRWITRRPLGHLGLVAGYAIAFGGTIRLALFREVAPRALPVTLYAFVAALVTTLFTVALARRYALLHADEVLAPERVARVARRSARRLERMARRGARRSGRSPSEPGPPETPETASPARQTRTRKTPPKARAASPRAKTARKAAGSKPR